MKHELKFPFVGSGDFKIYIYKEKETKGMKNEMKKKNNKGFSLVELIVVIAIMAVLMVVLAPAMLRYVEKSRIQKDESAVSEAANAAELALAEESIYSAANGAATITVTVKDDAAITAAAGGATFTDLQTEVQSTVGQKIDFVSKKYNSASAQAVITIQFDSSRQAYVLNKIEWTDADGKKSTTTLNEVKTTPTTPTT